MSPFRITWEGDQALSLRLPPAYTLENARRIAALTHVLEEAHLPFVRALSPACCALLVHLAPDQPGADRADEILLSLSEKAWNEESQASPACLTVPVVYGGAFGPDLPEVARHCGKTPEEVIRLHTARSLYVVMLGFVAGFPYLLGMDPTLSTPRRKEPRHRICAGSVGIAGEQTGVYPCPSPGGWQIIGRTPLRLFDPRRDPPALLRPGMELRFQSMTPEACRTWQEENRELCLEDFQEGVCS